MELLALAGSLLSLVMTFLPSYNIKITALAQWLLYLSLFQVSPQSPPLLRVTPLLSAGWPDLPSLPVGHPPAGDWPPGYPRQPGLPGQ